jgi:hypothetical protein
VPLCTAVLLKMQVLWGVTPCRSASSFRRFEGSYCLHGQELQEE